MLSALRYYDLVSGRLVWLEGFPSNALAFRNGNVTVIANIGSTPIPLPHGSVIAASGPITGGVLPVDTAVWLEADRA